MRCTRCIAAFQCNEPTGAYDTFEDDARATEPFTAEVVYNGESLCSRHFNTVRGHPADFVRYPETPHG